MGLNYEVAKGTMNLIANQCKEGWLETCCITKDDFDKLTAPVCWLSVDRNRVTQTFFSLLYGTVDAIGIPRFTLPAEYIASAISVYIDPVNVLVACRFFEKVPTAEGLGRGVDNIENVTSKQLFGLVVQLVADVENSNARCLFEKKTGLVVSRTKRIEMLEKKKRGDIDGKKYQKT